jgi:aryl-alcohol dehydrogenase-like predicted oxidoreductase
MQYKRLGHSDLEISRIGFGCMSLKAGNADTQQLLQKAVESGINFFDTADLYEKGLNEERVGEALRPFRNMIILATKVGNQWREDGSGWDWNPRKEYILAAVDKSLARLKTDYIDLYQLHGGTIEDRADETIEAFEILKDQGKIRYYGISSIRPNVIRTYLQKSHITSVMMQYSLLDRRPEEEMLNLLKECGVGVLVRGTVAGGLLIDKEPVNYLQHSAETVKKAAAAMREVSTNGRHPVQSSICYALMHQAVTSAVVGIRTREQLEEAVSTIESPSLNEDEFRLLQSAVPVIRYQEHR